MEQNSPVQAEAAAISLHNISKTYDQTGQFAVREVDLSITRGSFVALIGTSGSGKTTLLKCINRLIEPDEGEILIYGQPAGDQAAHELRRHVGYVFQGIGLFPHLTVAENIGITPELLGWSRADIESRVSELLELVELPDDYGARMPDALSGGQRQRVGIARALAARPGTLLMDEPFGALDPVTRETLGNACRALHDRLGLTTVMVTHDIFEALLLADRIIVLREGQIVADGTPRTLFLDPPDEGVRSLMAMPLRHADRVQALLGDTAKMGQS